VLSFITYFRWSLTSTIWPSKILSASTILFCNSYSFERQDVHERFVRRVAGTESIRVLVVEDHHMVRQGLVALLNVADGLEVVGEAEDGAEAITQFRKHQPAVTLIDLRLPRLSGVEVIERIRMETPNARFIVLTTYDGDEDIYRALQAGARAYLLKGMTSEELIATIRTVHAGRSYIPSAIAGKLAGARGHKGADAAGNRSAGADRAW
jgi:DNA-binding NarL/FixJ family response regulator